MLGAVDVNMGTRFLASVEAPIEHAWKAAIVSAHSENAMKVEVLNDIQPLVQRQPDAPCITINDSHHDGVASVQL